MGLSLPENCEEISVPSGTVLGIVGGVKPRKTEEESSE